MQCELPNKVVKYVFVESENRFSDITNLCLFSNITNRLSDITKSIL